MINREELLVENVGPIKKINLKIKKVNLFIGKNGTGKSICGKILQIKRNVFQDKKLEESFGIKSYIDSNSKIDYTNHNKLEKELNNISKLLQEKIEINDIDNNIFLKALLNADKKSFLNKNEKLLIEIAKKIILYEQDVKNSYYIPVERSMVPFLSSYGINFLSAKIPLPQYILEFASNFRLAKDNIKKMNIFNFTYKYEDDEDRIYVNKNNFISLKEASSGVQALLPLKLTVAYLNNKKKKKYILEEPELNLFPEEQFEIVKFMVENSNNIIFISHSPYIVSSLNLLLYAYKVGNINDKTKKQVDEIISQKYWINPNEFSAYYFNDGFAKNIVSNGLIGENSIDDVTDKFNDLYDEINEIYYRAKNDKKCIKEFKRHTVC